MPRERMSTCASRGVMRVIRPTTVSPTLRTEDAAADRLRLACTILPVTIPATDARSAPSHTNVEPASAGVLAGNLSPGTTIVSAAIFLVLYCFSWSEPSDTRGSSLEAAVQNSSPKSGIVCAHCPTQLGEKHAPSFPPLCIMSCYGGLRIVYTSFSRSLGTTPEGEALA